MSDTARILASTSWLALSTVDLRGAPQASYVPFALLSDGLCIVTRRNAAYAASLRERRHACVLVVSDDLVASEGSYARARLSIEVFVRPVASNSEEADVIWSALETRHGDSIKALRRLFDFDSLILEPFHARLILGFASAQDLNRFQVLEQIREAMCFHLPR